MHTAVQTNNIHNARMQCRRAAPGFFSSTTFCGVLLSSRIAVLDEICPAVLEDMRNAEIQKCSCRNAGRQCCINAEIQKCSNAYIYAEIQCRSAAKQICRNAKVHGCSL
jgi:hypothetical protein